MVRPISTIATTDQYHGFARYCVPMDGHRPWLDLRFYQGICPDQNGASSRIVRVYLTQYFQVPVIAVFTKYDQFRRNVEMDVSDFPDKYLDSNVSQVVKKQFEEYYLRPLGDDVRYVQLESMLLCL